MNDGTKIAIGVTIAGCVAFITFLIWLFFKTPTGEREARLMLKRVDTREAAAKQALDQWAAESDANRDLLIQHATSGSEK